jgi:hypothetical protein
MKMTFYTSFTDGVCKLECQDESGRDLVPPRNPFTKGLPATLGARQKRIHIVMQSMAREAFEKSELERRWASFA